MNAIKIFFVIFVVFISTPSHSLTLDANLFYLSDSLSISSDTTNSRMFADVDILINLTKKGRFVVGWNYSIVQATDDNAGTEVSYTTSEMGPIFGGYFDKAKTWPLFFSYNLLTTADYDDGAGTTEEWRGTSYRLSFGKQSPITETFYAGLFLNYYTASYSESLSGTTTFATVSNSRAIIYPSFSMSYRFD